jgi:hypothetical protein
MPVPSWTQTVDTIFTSTWAYRQTKAIEQAFLKTPFLFWLQKNDGAEKVSGYTRLEVPLDYGDVTNIAWISRGDTVDITTDSEILTMCYEDWKYGAATILRFGVDDQKNKGKAQIINYVTAKLNAAERALRKELETRLLSAPTDTKQIFGLQTVVSDSPTTGVLHGVDRATYAWFRNQTVDATGKPFSTYGVSLMRNMLNTITKYSDVDLNQISIWTNQEVFEAYEDTLLEYYRIVDKDMADVGFDSLKYKGRVLAWSPYMPTITGPKYRIYFINTGYLKFYYDPDEFFRMTEWKPITDQVDDRVAHIKVQGNFVTNRPVALGVIYNVTI